MSLKNSNETIGNRTRDLPVCSVVTECTSEKSERELFISSDIRTCNVHELFKDR